MIAPSQLRGFHPDLPELLIVQKSQFFFLARKVYVQTGLGLCTPQLSINGQCTVWAKNLFEAFWSPCRGLQESLYKHGTWYSL